MAGPHTIGDFYFTCFRAEQQQNRKNRELTSRFPDFLSLSKIILTKKRLGTSESEETDFIKNESFDASKRADERKFGKMAKRICEKNGKNDDEDGFGSTHFGG